ncbi:hypothetical protein ACR9GK_04765 [Enterobacter hormaechei subsp. steigerwaltii]
MSVKRYQPAPFTERVLHASDDGKYVKHDDYAALEAKFSALAAENAGLKKFITQECHVAHVEPETFYEEEITRYVNADGYEPETPATDAFLAEVQASAIEHAAADRWGSGYIFNELNELAAQIRKGVHS